MRCEKANHTISVATNEINAVKHQPMQLNTAVLLPGMCTSACGADQHRHAAPCKLKHAVRPAELLLCNATNAPHKQQPGQSA